MKIFTTQGNKFKATFLKLLVAFFWIVVWHILSLVISHEVLLASPVNVVRKLFELVHYSYFWTSIGHSLFNVFFGFCIAIFVGTSLACLTTSSKALKTFLDPILLLIKAIPVASFTVLALLWIKSYRMSMFIVFFMVLPIIYFNVVGGIESTDKKLLEMAQIFKVRKFKKFRQIYVPSVLPYFFSACQIGVGFAWKSGVAAEVIALPARSIGINIYDAKIYLENTDLLAWTVITVVLSVLVEKILMFLIQQLKKYARGL